MPFLTLIITLAIIGVILYLIEQKLPMDDTIKLLIRVIVVIAVILYLVKFFNIHI